ncbi:ribosome small subunit-dependent GTPase A [Anaerosacchariphilus sp. NSJ-68]|uniref:Small ribosomal subunit biogenesis GTPase RsgA n=2 Tax=Lachnospiraceae TaxID=186803 RepID=A0A923LAR5_9FIRM|nr:MULTISPECIES: ribosome small subunit-dependent GTPase A [Lachnospiraceae]MBC5658857.1 ribosome small subunit-dependent GTPase A [Anaerosacchariphilus hominis]MBC5698874.1 ribosome small subunit-dependent GTPase A [Roseburia difficilis]
MQGKIIKGIAGFYYVHVAESGIYECKAKGSFRNQKVKPLVGDDVRLEVLNEEEKKGNIEEILPRKNQLIRPAVANVDQALMIFSAAKPRPNFNLLDRFLILMEYQQVPVVVCFNKQDLAAEEELAVLEQTYRSAGYEVRFTSAAREEGLGEIRALLKGKTSTVAGPSGVGKSSLINLLVPEAEMETGNISRKIERGKHTTRHSELFALEEGGFIFDTPGFSSIYLPDMEKEELGTYFPEFARYEPKCRFQGCAHIHEPGCGVKEALEAGEISPIRYENYKLLYEELKEKRRY